MRIGEKTRAAVTRRLRLWLFLILPPTMIYAQGAELLVQLTNTATIEGELLAVRDSVLVLSTRKGLSEQELAAGSELIAVPGEEIHRVIIQGESKVLNHMGQGFLLGAGIGGLIGFLSGDDPPGFFSMTASEKALAVGIALGGVGLVVGTISGIAATPADRVIDPLPGHSFALLKQVARYPAVEPAFLDSVKTFSKETDPERQK